MNRTAGSHLRRAFASRCAFVVLYSTSQHCTELEYTVSSTGLSAERTLNRLDADSEHRFRSAPFSSVQFSSCSAPVQLSSAQCTKRAHIVCCSALLCFHPIPFHTLRFASLLFSSLLLLFSLLVTLLLLLLLLLHLSSVLCSATGRVFLRASSFMFPVHCSSQLPTD